MSRSKLIRITILAAALGSSSAAFAKQMHRQSHHCRMPDGTVDTKKTHRECRTVKGTWAKDAPNQAPNEALKPNTTPAHAPAPGPTPAPSPAPTPSPAPAPPK